MRGNVDFKTKWEEMNVSNFEGASG
jgi:hypothetical protein